MSAVAEIVSGTDTTAAVAIVDPVLRGHTIAALERGSAQMVEENFVGGDPDKLLDFIERTQPGLLFLGMHGLDGDFAEAMARIARLKPAPRVIVVNERAEPEIIVKAMRAGAAEFVYPPLELSFDEAVGRVIADRQRSEQAQKRAGGVIGFVSAKGGCGATTLACHCAAWLRSHANKEVMLADLDSASGMAGVLMQAPAKYTFDDALKNLHRLDARLWKAMVAVSPSGVEVMAASAAGTGSGGQKSAPVLRFCRTQYEFTLTDLGHGMNESLCEVLESLDTLVLVATNEVPALRQARQMIRLLAQRGFGGKRLKLVINRMPKRAPIQAQELEKAIGHPIHMSLPNNYALLSEAYSEPRLVDLKSELGSRMGELAESLAGLSPAEKKSRGFLGFLRDKKK